MRACVVVALLMVATADVSAAPRDAASARYLRRNRAVGATLLAWSVLMLAGGVTTAAWSAYLHDYNRSGWLTFPELEQGNTIASALFFGAGAFAMTLGAWVLHLKPATREAPTPLVAPVPGGAVGALRFRF